MASVQRPGAQQWVPDDGDIPRLQGAVQECRGCELWQDATQAVFGEGPATATIMLVGEQPGDREDLAGEPFVGPAGRLLDDALARAGIDRRQVYVTNAVKHFRFELRGKRRIHASPQVGHINACRPWLDAELERVDPQVVVCLGATSARGVLGRPVRIGVERGRVITELSRDVVITVHPSSIIRLQEPEERDAALSQFVADLGVALSHLSTR